MESTCYFYLPQNCEQLRFVLTKINDLSSEVTTLNLEKNDFTPYSIDLINEIFSAIPLHILHLKLSHCQLEHMPDVAAFFACIPRHLVSLDLSWNGLSYLTAEMVSHLPKQLKQINLALNEFNVCFEFFFFESLLKMLIALPKQMAVLNFSGNNLSDLGDWQVLFKIISAMPRALEALNLSSNGLAYFLSEMKDIFRGLPDTLYTIELAHNCFSSNVFLSTDIEVFKHAIKNNDIELMMLLDAIPVQVKNLKLQNIMLPMDKLRPDLIFWQNYRNLQVLGAKSSLPIKNKLELILQQFQKLYDAKEDLDSINLLVKDSLGVVLGQIGLEEFRLKAKTLQGHVSPMWNILGALMLALSAILFCQGFYICGSFTLLSAAGFYYKGQTFGLYKSAQQIDKCLVDNSRLIL